MLFFLHVEYDRTKIFSTKVRRGKNESFKNQMVAGVIVSSEKDIVLNSIIIIIKKHI
jgi:hypothetical protein